VERLRGNRWFSAAHSSFTAAVVGANLALWFGLKIIFPSWAQVDIFSLTLAVFAGWVLIRRKWPVAPVLLGCALAGLVSRLVLG
jgi:chromate transporter